ncbi:MAG TPA: cupin domain-containing protein [Actinomycetota bacterium]|nr:cupin domain-containing protein [Actinomycetota bacterium]
MAGIYRITPDERVEGQPTPGLRREQAVQTEGMWGGYATTEPGMVSGWHHHADYESTIYVIAGALRMEFGAGGGESFDAGPGDFVFVGKDVVHRESNPSDEPSHVVVVRAGSGEAVVNVDGPDPA